MMVTTIENMPGREIKEVLGVVFGSCVQMKHVGKDIRAMGRNILGGEAKAYTELMEESRRTAMQRMIEDAEKLGANAVIGMRYATAQTMHGAAELIAFGTAVRTC
ncbi:MAG: YbjQ family protein [Thermoplasmatales archaeon]|nr:YbjQ family protein [Thermoplasmatales archaeon]